MSILVCPLSRVAELVGQRRPARVISVLDPDGSFPALGPDYIDRHLRLTFHDVHFPAPGVVVPSAQHVLQLMTFLDHWDAAESLLVHCRAGIGRSTATAFIAACYRNPGSLEIEIARALRRIAPLARPNERWVQLADAVMERKGRMLEAIVETGRGLGWVDVAEGVPFELPLSFGEVS